MSIKPNPVQCSDSTIVTNYPEMKNEHKGSVPAFMNARQSVGGSRIDGIKLEIEFYDNLIKQYENSSGFEGFIAWLGDKFAKLFQKIGIDIKTIDDIRALKIELETELKSLTDNAIIV